MRCTEVSRGGSIRRRGGIRRAERYQTRAEVSDARRYPARGIRRGEVSRGGDARRGIRRAERYQTRGGIPRGRYQTRGGITGAERYQTRGGCWRLSFGQLLYFTRTPSNVIVRRVSPVARSVRPFRGNRPDPSVRPVIGFGGPVSSSGHTGNLGPVGPVTRSVRPITPFRLVRLAGQFVRSDREIVQLG